MAQPDNSTRRTAVAYEEFCSPGLTERLRGAEKALRGATIENLSAALDGMGANAAAMTDARYLKELVGQLNVAIHALGILLCLPQILEPGEVVKYASLGAGNTGKEFDLETSVRVAEFKLIRWRGGSESIRQNAVFKDFYRLAEADTDKRRYLYVLGTEYPLRFLNGGRSLSSVLKDAFLAAEFRAKYGDRYRSVRDYFLPRQRLVAIHDISDFLPSLAF